MIPYVLVPVNRRRPVRLYSITRASALLSDVKVTGSDPATVPQKGEAWEDAVVCRKVEGSIIRLTKALRDVLHPLCVAGVMGVLFVPTRPFKYSPKPSDHRVTVDEHRLRPEVQCNVFLRQYLSQGCLLDCSWYALQGLSRKPGSQLASWIRAKFVSLALALALS